MENQAEKRVNQVVDLFSGCGGMSLGFQRAGFDIVAAFEHWDKAANCYAANFSHPVYRDDLSDVANAITKIRALSPDIITGGPPCQDFSGAGKRVEGERANLTVSFAEIIVGVRPKFFVMENVPCARKSEAYATARKLSKNAGYGLTEVVLNAALCGVPQRRKRFICIGSLGAADNFLSAYIAKNLSKAETTMRDYFGNALGVEHYYAQAPYKAGLRRTIFSIDEPSATIRGVNGNIPKKFVAHPGDACALDDTIRKLTYLERAQIQTFPSDFYWNGSLGKKGGTGDIEQMIGNAVPVKLAEFVATALAHHIGTRKAGV